MSSYAPHDQILHIQETRPSARRRPICRRHDTSLRFLRYLEILRDPLEAVHREDEATVCAAEKVERLQDALARGDGDAGETGRDTEEGGKDGGRKKAEGRQELRSNGQPDLRTEKDQWRPTR